LAALTQAVYVGIPPDACMSEFGTVKTTVSPSLTPVAARVATLHVPLFSAGQLTDDCNERCFVINVPLPMLIVPLVTRELAVTLPFTV